VLRGATALGAAVVAVVLVLSGCSAPTPAAAPEPITTTAIDPTPTMDPTPTPSPTLTAEPTTPPTTTRPPSKPTTTRPATTTRSTPQWTYAPSGGPTAGTGTVWHYRIAVETGVAVGIGDLTAVVNATLDDPRSWTAGGTIQFQQVGPSDGAQFTVWLANPSTAYSMCIAGGIDIRVGGVPYTSCRVGSNVVLNSSRYLNGVPSYGAPLSAYRQYMVNHEVGHRLGFGHVLCPAAGKPAPVMEQQTLGLQGCVANSWPYINGALYSGPAA
jgi:hypothetical protein